MRLVPVSGSDDPALEVYTKLSEVQLRRLYEPDGGLFIAESPKVIRRALDAGCTPVSALVEDRKREGDAATARVLADCDASRREKAGGELTVYTGRYEALIHLTGFALTRGVLCAMRRPPLPDPGNLLAREDIRRIAVLENVMNPANVGTIFRNAAALGMDAVLLTDGCSDPLYRRALRVGMGTPLQVPWAWCSRSMQDWKENGMYMLRRAGFRTIAMALREDAAQLREIRLQEGEKAAVLLGTEGDGLCAETIRAADDVVMIPMAHGVDSLNVAAASAIAMYQMGPDMDRVKTELRPRAQIQEKRSCGHGHEYRKTELRPRA